MSITKQRAIEAIAELPEQDGAPPLTPREVAELDSRVQEHRDDPAGVVPWSEIRRGFDARLGRRAAALSR